MGLLKSHGRFYIFPVLIKFINYEDLIKYRLKITQSVDYDRWIVYHWFIVAGLFILYFKFKNYIHNNFYTNEINSIPLTVFYENEFLNLNV